MIDSIRSILETTILGAVFLTVVIGIIGIIALIFAYKPILLLIIFGALACFVVGLVIRLCVDTFIV